MKVKNIFDAKEAAPALPQRREGAQRISKYFFATVGTLVPLRLGVRFLCFISLLFLGEFPSVSAQTSIPQVSVTVSVHDANGEPVSGIRVELVIFQYAMSVEPLPAGGCETDETGACMIWADLPPSSGADWYEGVVYVSDLGRQLVGWQGNETLIVIQLTPDGMIATEEPHLHGPYTGEQYAPTEGSPSETPTVTATLTETPFPTETLAPTFTQTLSPTLTPSLSPDVLESPFPLGWVIIGGLVFGAVLWWVHSHRIKRHG